MWVCHTDLVIWGDRDRAPGKSVALAAALPGFESVVVRVSIVGVNIASFFKERVCAVDVEEVRRRRGDECRGKE